MADSPMPQTAAERELIAAIYATVEYVGLDVLRPLPGWTWFDALSRHDDPERFTEWLARMPGLVSKTELQEVEYVAQGHEGDASYDGEGE